MENDLISQHYDRQAVIFGRTPESCDYRCKASFLQRQRAALKFLSSVKGETLLDVGCGPGLLTESIGKENFLVGLDLSSKMLDLAKTSHKPILGAGETLPFRNHSFDRVLAIETLQHVTNPAVFLKELARVTKKGGEVILSALHRDSFLHRFFRPFGGYRGLHFYSLKEVCEMLEKSGFIRKETLFLGFPFPFIWQAAPHHFFSPLATSWMSRFRNEPHD